MWHTVYQIKSKEKITMGQISSKSTSIIRIHWGQYSLWNFAEKAYGRVRLMFQNVVETCRSQCRCERYAWHENRLCILKPPVMSGLLFLQCNISLIRNWSELCTTPEETTLSPELFLKLHHIPNRPWNCIVPQTVLETSKSFLKLCNT